MTIVFRLLQVVQFSPSGAVTHTPINSRELVEYVKPPMGARDAHTDWQKRGASAFTDE